MMWHDGRRARRRCDQNRPGTGVERPHGSQRPTAGPMTALRDLRECRARHLVDRTVLAALSVSRLA